jgi:hypothetical protein
MSPEPEGSFAYCAAASLNALVTLRRFECSADLHQADQLWLTHPRLSVYFQTA